MGSRHSSRNAPSRGRPDRDRESTASDPTRTSRGARFDPAELATLTESIREHGVLQPILVTEAVDGYRVGRGRAAPGARRSPPGSSGSRRSIRQLDDRAATRDRPDREPPARGPRPDRGRAGLPAADRRIRLHARADRREAIGRARSTVANTLRLLDLAPAVQAAVADRRLTEGHARALGGLSTEHQEHVLGTVVTQDLSVRQTEELVRRLREPGDPSAGRPLSIDVTIRTSSAWRRTSAARSGPR